MLKRVHYNFILLTAILLLLLWLEAFPDIILKYYSSACYIYISSVIRAITGIFPFAAGDLLYLIIILAALVAIFIFFKGLKNRKITATELWKVPFKLANLFLLVLIIFKIIWGLNYSRPRVNRQLGIAGTPYSVNELAKLGGFLILKLSVLKPDRQVHYSIKQLEKEAVNAYQALEKANPLFRYNNPAVKPALNSTVITKIGLEGYYNPFSGEANINMELPQFVLPFTTCHEIAHQLGIAREDEANLLAYLTAINSDDVNFRYSAYYDVLRSVLYELSFKSPEKFKILYALLPAQVLADFKAESAFWKKNNNKMFDYMEAALDNYLKFNHQEQGINSYQNIVLWVFNFHKEEF